MICLFEELGQAIICRFLLSPQFWSFVEKKELLSSQI